MAANKTAETSTDVAVFVADVADPVQRADAEALVAIMAKASGDPPRMWGPSIIGFGSYHYKYESGREGDSLRIGFSPRKGQTVIYLADSFPGHADLMARLGKHKTGKSCLYIKRLSDVDLGILGELIDASLAEMHRRYPPA
jgi:Domain of unknown function (DU1801)